MSLDEIADESDTPNKAGDHSPLRQPTDTSLPVVVEKNESKKPRTPRIYRVLEEAGYPDDYIAGIAKRGIIDNKMSEEEIENANLELVVRLLNEENDYAFRSDSHLKFFAHLIETRGELPAERLARNYGANQKTIDHLLRRDEENEEPMEVPDHHIMSKEEMKRLGHKNTTLERIERHKDSLKIGLKIKGPDNEPVYDRRELDEFYSKNSGDFEAASTEEEVLYAFVGSVVMAGLEDDKQPLFVQGVLNYLGSDKRGKVREVVMSRMHTIEVAFHALGETPETIDDKVSTSSDNGSDNGYDGFFPISKLTKINDFFDYEGYQGHIDQLKPVTRTRHNIREVNLLSFADELERNHFAFLAKALRKYDRKQREKKPKEESEQST